jgi:hypothetical protein
MYEDLARSVLIEDDPAVLAAIESVRSRHPELSKREMDERLESRTAWRCASVGAAVSAGAELLGGFVAAADLSYQVVALSRLASTIAQVHRRRMTMTQRGIAAAGSLAAAGASEAVRRGASRVARRALGRRAPGLVPILSAVAGGAAAYGAVKIFARLAREFVAGISPRR